MVLEIANKKKKTVLIASTSEVYGLSDRVPFREDGNLVLGATNKGRWSYACSKAIDEFLALAYWREKKLPTIIVRLFNTVGPRQTGQYGMVVPRFVRQALSGAPLTVFGDGKQTRCFCHVNDVVSALMNSSIIPPRSGRSSTSARRRKSPSASSRRPYAVSPARPRRSFTSPTTRPTKKDSKTCPAAFRTRRRSTISSDSSRRIRSRTSCAA